MTANESAGRYTLDKATLTASIETVNKAAAFLQGLACRDDFAPELCELIQAHGIKLQLAGDALAQPIQAEREEAFVAEQARYGDDVMERERNRARAELEDFGMIRPDDWDGPF